MTCYQLLIENTINITLKSKIPVLCRCRIRHMENSLIGINNPIALKNRKFFIFLKKRNNYEKENCSDFSWEWSI